MVKIIMHGCNGHMGQVISGLVEKDPDAEIVAGIDVADQGKNSYPVYTNMEECQVEADPGIGPQRSSSLSPRGRREIQTGAR